ncbi:hypothetical protein SAMN02745150_00083 [Brevinema andersonii]|uniref:FlgD Ig-like domain-containing protein n=1 Tax=Brevinema andersonii TaxID=34097 RepID=A0A1I1D3D4_BREAD|nr:hypothetical protein [Brevinema andersonii]SFB67608.1 hypothetical protein SAMN02745150_00083 [Brevinema andersonii]
MRKKYFFLLALIFCLSPFDKLQAIGKVFAWRYEGLPSLTLTESVGVTFQKDGLAADIEASRHFITIEDINIPKYSQILQLFVSFDKTNYTSFVVVKFFDTFTDRLLSEISFNETGAVYLESTDLYPNRIYFKIELFGQDIRLRSAGITTEPRTIIEPQNLTLSSEIVYLSNNVLKIQAKLNQEAEVQLYIYDNAGSVSKKIVSGQVYPAGVYEFYWDTNSLILDSGKTFYVWFHARNLRSKPVEYIRNVLVIP